LEMLYEDVGTDQTKAASSTKKLIDIDSVDALFTITTPPAAVMVSLAEESNTPFIYGSSTSSLAVGKKYTFNDYPSMADNCELLMSAASGVHGKVAFFGTNAEFTQLCKEGIERVGTLNLFEMYTPGDTDFRVQFTKIKSSESTALILLAFAGDCDHAFKQMQELGISLPVYTPLALITCGSQERIDKYSDMLKGGFGTDLAFNPEDEKYVEFKRRLGERGRTTEIQGSAIAYDSVMEMADSYKDCKDTDCVVDNLRKLTEYDGLLGTIGYNGKQTVERQLRVIKFKDRGWKSV